MTKKRLSVIVGMTAFIALALMALTMLLPRPGVTEANFARIQDGMTRDEVEAILGDPSAGGGPSPKIFISPRPELGPGGAEIRWRGNNGIITIQFDEKEIVVHKAMNGSPESVGY